MIVTHDNYIRKHDHRKNTEINVFSKKKTSRLLYCYYYDLRNMVLNYRKDFLNIPKNPIFNLND